MRECGEVDRRKVDVVESKINRVQSAQTQKYEKKGEMKKKFSVLEMYSLPDKIISLRR